MTKNVASRDKREGWKRLPRSAARSKSAQPDPQLAEGHAQKITFQRV